MNWYKLYKIAEPIGEFRPLDQNWDQHNIDRFEDFDRNVINSPKAIENIKKRWEKVGPWINVYFTSEKKEELTDTTGLLYPEIQSLRDPNKVTLIITNSQRHPTTAWMIAHRLSHALNISDINYRTIVNQIANCYSIDIEKNDFSIGTTNLIKLITIRKIISKMLTMKSARNEELDNINEGFHELFAQYLMTGKITLNPLPKEIEFAYQMSKGKYPIKATKFKDTSKLESEFLKTLTNQFNKILQKLNGRILFDPPNDE